MSDAFSTVPLASVIIVPGYTDADETVVEVEVVVWVVEVEVVVWVVEVEVVEAVVEVVVTVVEVEVVEDVVVTGAAGVQPVGEQSFLKPPASQPADAPLLQSYSK